MHGELIVLVGIGLVESCPRPGGELSRMEFVLVGSWPVGELSWWGSGPIVGSCPG